ncbi:Hsp70 family protein [Prochlorococcus marinus]|uniref:Hsp70 family protein n=1 Tax=Prochlorococcus marinus TaxID=1219 RepID=UPI0022B3AC7D|nr:Hsp70 family protein [Prochlorococcus marinus]
MKNNLLKSIGTLSIDLGSSTTVIAFQPENEASVKLLELPPITRCPGEIPSLIWQANNEECSLLVGNQITELQLSHQNNPSLISDFKRWIGAPKNESHWEASLSPEDAGEILIKEIWRRIPTEYEIRKLVLAAPVETYKEYRKWLNKVCSKLEVQEIALVDEPTAAAIGAGQQGGSKLLVIDIGGSTIDMSMVRIEGGEGEAQPIAQLIRFNGKDLEGISKQIMRGATVLGKAGLRLGGRDIDRWIANYLLPNNKQTNSLLNASEKLKCNLSNLEILDTKVLKEDLLDNEREEIKELQLSRSELEELLKRKGLFKSLSNLLEQTLSQGRSNGYELEDLTGVVIVGGGSRMPAIKKWILQKIRPEKLLTPPPIEAVAIGALKLTPGVMVKDVLTNGVSLRFWDQKTNQHIWHPLFLAGQTWPTSKPLEILISASEENQQEIELIIADNGFNKLKEVIYIDGIPSITNNDKIYQPKIVPWKDVPTIIKLNKPTEPGIDCLKLFFHINNSCELYVEGIDLRDGTKVIEKVIGLIR